MIAISKDFRKDVSKSSVKTLNKTNICYKAKSYT